MFRVVLFRVVLFRVSLNLFRVVLFRVSLLRVGGVVSLLHVDPACVLRGYLLLLTALFKISLT